MSKKNTDAICTAILAEVADGAGLIKSIRAAGMGLDRFYAWLEASPENQDKYARASKLRADAMFEEILEIADDGRRDYTETADGREVPDHDHIQRSKLRVDSRKWMLAKMMPKKYGDKVEHAIGGNGEPVLIQEVQRVIIDGKAED